MFFLEVIWHFDILMTIESFNLEYKISASIEIIFPQIFLIPRTSRQVYNLIEMFNDEYISREEDISFNGLKIPKGCEIMGYVI